MKDTEIKMWGIHTKDDSLFLKEKVVAIGWKPIGDLSLLYNSREAFKEQFSKVFPDSTKNKTATSAGMLFRFYSEAKVGDYIVYPSKIDRKVHIGKIEGDYVFDNAQERYPHTRKVSWIKELPRTSFSQGALYEIGSALTFFSVKNYSDEFLTALDPNFKPSLDEAYEDDSVGAVAEDIIESTKDFVLKELSRHLKGYDFQDFVANLLQTMGYRTTVTPHGGDSGIDIIAYKDELPPRILVQVKSQDSKISENVIQSLKGAMREGDYGLFVTLSDYQKNARKYLDNTPIIRGINGTELVDLILQHYDQLDEEYQKIIPLKMVYIPVPLSDEDDISQ